MLHRINLREVWTDTQHANGVLRALTIFVATITFPVRTIRWQLILRDANGQRFPWTPLWHATAIGFMANNLLPARAGEVARAYVASRQLPVRLSTALASLVVERVFDGLVMLGLMAVAIAAPSFPAHALVGDARSPRSRPPRRHCSERCSYWRWSSYTGRLRGCGCSSGSRVGSSPPVWPAD